MLPADRPRYEYAAARARAALGGEAFDRAWAEGKTMSLDRAIDSVLSDSRS